MSQQHEALSMYLGPVIGADKVVGQTPPTPDDSPEYAADVAYTASPTPGAAAVHAVVKIEA